jgi:hypothetical protein
MIHRHDIKTIRTMLSQGRSVWDIWWEFRGVIDKQVITKIMKREAYRGL